MKERLQKYLARCGIASRRKAEELILEGRIKVNGDIVRAVIIVDEEKDKIEFDGKIVRPEEKKVYIMLNKPTGIITSAKDQFGRRTVTDLVDINERVYPVGRLDYDTSGLLILTNDGDAAFSMAHPSHEINKVYIAEIRGIPNEEEIARFKNGLRIEDYITSPADIKLLMAGPNTSSAEITIHEGRNRQVRKMCAAIGHPVKELKRIRIGDLCLGDLPTGQWRYLCEKEIKYLISL